MRFLEGAGEHCVRLRGTLLEVWGTMEALQQAGRHCRRLGGSTLEAEGSQGARGTEGHYGRLGALWELAGTVGG